MSFSLNPTVPVRPSEYLWQLNGYIMNPLHLEHTSSTYKTRNRNQETELQAPRQSPETTDSSTFENAKLIDLVLQRITNLERQHEDLLNKEQHWPQRSPDHKQLYSNFYDEIHQLSTNYICGSCGCIHHGSSQLTLISTDSDLLNPLIVPRASIEFPYSCSDTILDDKELMVDPLGLDTERSNLYICSTCLRSLQLRKCPTEALANYRWINPVQPPELSRLNWIEELLIARGHLVGTILRLQKRSGSYYGLKGHAIILPQETAELLNILPQLPSVIAQSVKVVWAGRRLPEESELKKYFTVNTEYVYAALSWLCQNHNDYKEVSINRSLFESWPPVFVVRELLVGISLTNDTTTDDDSRMGFATEEIDNSQFSGDLPITTSAIIDTNSISQPTGVSTLTQLADLRASGESPTSSQDATPLAIKVVLGSTIKQYYNDSSYFTSCFPTLFPYGTAKHLDPRRSEQLTLPKWTALMLKHSSRRFQQHRGFVFLSFDLARRNYSSMSSKLQTNRTTWQRTKILLESLTPNQLTNAAQQAQLYQPITDSAVKELLKLVNRVGASEMGSDEKKVSMLAQLKSSIVYFGSPIIFLTLNPGERHSPLALLYAGQSINVKDFHPSWYSSEERLKVMLDHPLAVVEYFHTMVNTVINTMIKDGLFGKVIHHYGPIEYQGRGTPHTHLLIWLEGTTSPDEMRIKATNDPTFKNNLLQFITRVATECLPTLPVGALLDDNLSDRIFQPYIQPDDPDFEYKTHLDLYDIIYSRQMHNPNHVPTCYKYGSRSCRSRFPRSLYTTTSMDTATGIITIQRDHPFVNGYNPMVATVMRANHDCQFLFTKAFALAAVYYVMKYISKPESSLHSKLTIAAAVRKALQEDEQIRTDPARSILVKTYNKIMSHREVGLPEAISHLLRFNDHFTNHKFQSIHTTSLYHRLNRTQLYDDTQILHESIDVTTEPAIDTQTGPADQPENLEIVRMRSEYQVVSSFDDYCLRGRHLKDLCLYDYCSLIYKKKRLSQGIPYHSDHPQYTTHRQFLRTEGAIPTLLGRILFLRSNTTDIEMRNEYFCILSGLFLPWGPYNPLRNSAETWETFFAIHASSLSARLKRHISNLNLLHKSKEEVIIDMQQRSARSEDVISTSYEDHNIIPVEETLLHEADSTTILMHMATDTLTFHQALAVSANSSPNDWYVMEALEAGHHSGILRREHTSEVNLRHDSETSSISWFPLSWKQLQQMIKTVVIPFSLSNNNISDNQLGYKEISNKRPGVFIIDMEEEIGDMELSMGITSATARRAVSVREAVDCIVCHFSFNEQQRLAFQVVVDQTIGTGIVGSQLRMGIFGEGGTGKSRLIEAITLWFKLLKRESELMVTATTGTAAIKIGGCTLHSAIGIRLDSSQSSDGSFNGTRLNANKISEWQDRTYIIIDEVSMMDAKVMTKMHIQLGKLKGKPDVLFGGVNIIVLGDFLQFPAVSKLDLFLPLVGSPWSQGHQLWRSLNSVVILVEQMRQMSDQRFAEMLSRIRMRHPTEADLALLNTRIGSELSNMDSATIIVRRHSLRHAINSHKLLHNAVQVNSRITYCIADILKNYGMKTIDIYNIKYGSSQCMGDAILPLFPGVPLMITKNIDAKLGLMNGSNVTFYGYGPGYSSYPSTFVSQHDFIHLPEYILVKVSDLQLHLPGLPPSVVPLKPIIFTWSGGRRRSVQMKQFPVTLAYSMTDYKCQGQTLDAVVLDLQKPRSGSSSPASLYVQLSRARSLDKISILRPFDSSELYVPLQPELLSELEWQRNMARTTYLAYEHHRILLFSNNDDACNQTNTHHRLLRGILGTVGILV